MSDADLLARMSRVMDIADWALLLTHLEQLQQARYGREEIEVKAGRICLFTLAFTVRPATTYWTCAAETAGDKRNPG